MNGKAHGRAAQTFALCKYMTEQWLPVVTHVEHRIEEWDEIPKCSVSVSKRSIFLSLLTFTALLCGNFGFRLLHSWQFDQVWWIECWAEVLACRLTGPLWNCSVWGLWENYWLLPGHHTNLGNCFGANAVFQILRVGRQSCLFLL